MTQIIKTCQAVEKFRCSLSNTCSEVLMDRERTEDEDLKTRTRKCLNLFQTAQTFFLSTIFTEQNFKFISEV